MIKEIESHSCLAGKKILITGATSGIGKATALLCAENGAHVIITGRSAEKINSLETLLQKYTDSYTSLCCDLIYEEDLARVVEQCNCLDGLVLCAGQVVTLPITFTSVGKVESLMNVNLIPSIYLTQKLLKNKCLRRHSSVVAITSVLGVTSYMPGNAAYGVSKAALESWIHYCALEYAKKDIRFNTIQPGGIDTPMADLTSLTQEQLIADREQVPMGRYGLPEEVAEVVLFFLSDQSSYVTGSSLIVDGGRHLKY